MNATQALTRVAAGIGLALAFSASALAATYYVSPTGRDASGAGVSEADPFRSVQYAVDRVAAGDTVVLLDGVYDEGSDGVRISRLGTSAAWITLKAKNKGGARVHATWAGTYGTNGPTATYPVLWFLPTSNCMSTKTDANCPPMYWRVEDLVITGGFYGVKMDAGQVKILNNDISGSEGDLVKIVEKGDNVTVYGNTLHEPRLPDGRQWDNPPLNSSGGTVLNNQAVDIVAADDVWVAYNHVYKIPNIAIYSKGSARRSLIENNRVEDVYLDALVLGQLTDTQYLRGQPYESLDSTLRNNTARNVKGACLNVSSASNAKVYNNTCYNVATNSRGGICVTNEDPDTKVPSVNVDIKNNIVVMGRPAASALPAVCVRRVGVDPDNSLRFNNNLFWHVDGQAQAAALDFVWFRSSAEINAGRPQIPYGTKLADWQRLTAQYGYPQDANSRMMDPGFMAATAVTPDFSLMQGSNAIDRGDAVICPQTDFASVTNPDTRPVDIRRPRNGDGANGAECDVGAYEYQVDQPPVARMTASPTSGSAPLSVSFNGSTSSDAEGPIAAYTWNFGDGTPTATGANVTHVYQAAGTYTATLTVRDSSNQTAQTSLTIQVGTGPVTQRIENNDSRLVYSPLGTGHWSLNGSGAAASGGNFAVANGATAKVTFSFTGTSIKWISLLDQYSGQAKVTLDGVTETVDNYRPSTAPDFGWQKIAWQKSNLANTSHTLTIEATGTKNPASGNVSVTIDAFDIN